MAKQTAPFVDQTYQPTPEEKFRNERYEHERVVRTFHQVDLDRPYLTNGALSPDEKKQEREDAEARREIQGAAAPLSASRAVESKPFTFGKA